MGKEFERIELIAGVRCRSYGSTGLAKAGFGYDCAVLEWEIILVGCCIA